MYKILLTLMGFTISNDKIINNEIILLKEICWNLSTSQKLVAKDDKIYQLLYEYWVNKPLNHQWNGYAINLSNNKIKFFFVNWNEKNILIKIFIHYNNLDDDFITITNDDNDSMKVQYNINKILEISSYFVLKNKYLQMNSKSDFSLKTNNLQWISYVLNNDFLKINNFYQRMKLYKILVRGYEIYYYDHQDYDIYIIVIDDKLKFFGIKRKNIYFKRLHHFIIIQL